MEHLINKIKTIYDMYEKECECREDDDKFMCQSCCAGNELSNVVFWIDGAIETLKRSKKEYVS